jgi:hypothetical protein
MLLYPQCHSRKPSTQPPPPQLDRPRKKNAYMRALFFKNRIGRCGSGWVNASTISPIPRPSYTGLNSIERIQLNVPLDLEGGTSLCRHARYVGWGACVRGRALSLRRLGGACPLGRLTNVLPFTPPYATMAPATNPPFYFKFVEGPCHSWDPSGINSRLVFHHASEQIMVVSVKTKPRPTSHPFFYFPFRFVF